ncbi:MAG: TIGR04283 family arsenosugar biosynthesis glycosyltransferase [Desulfuromonadaceae bacterium]
MAQQLISIIIPTYNEEAIIAESLQVLLSITDKNERVEIIVSDASTDSTADLVSNFPVTLCRSEKGRSRQMNAGAACARGEILYFLHADTLPPETFVDDIRSAVASGKKAGCFRMKFTDGNPIMAIYGWFTRIPVMLCRGGDQSLFLERVLFTAIKGFDENLAIMEDIDIIARIKSRLQFHIIENYVTTSSRKFRDNGIIRLQFIFGTIHLMYALGFEQESIVRYYRGKII